MFLLAPLVIAIGAIPGAQAVPVLDPGTFPELDAHMARHQRQFDRFNSYPFGLSLNVHVQDAAARAAITDFLNQDDQTDFPAFAGAHQHEMMTQYGEHGDLGFFGGVALIGTAFRYLTLARDGAPAGELADAKARLHRAARSWHVFKVVTGGNGLVARGIDRLLPENPEDPAAPGNIRPLIPLADESGNPLPSPKDNGTWREDLSDGALPEGVWKWSDSCSKDQLVGQILGMVVMHDALKADPEADPALLEDIAADARAIAGMLMTRREISGMEGPIGEGEYDLIIMDADGRPTMFHDLNPLSIEKVYLPLGSSEFNVFNLFMAVAVMKGLHHVSGDPDIEKYLYQELLGNRDYLGKIKAFDGPDAFNYIYMGHQTNTDNPDMTSVALFLILYLETDPGVIEPVRRFLEEGWWAPKGQYQAASLSKMPLWHAIYLAVTDTGSKPDLALELAGFLRAFPLGPYWQDTRINCDEDELAASECLALDGMTILTLVATNERGDALASEALDPSIRPNSDFNARSNPFRVNGTGDGKRLNPGGDLLASWWMSRYMSAPGSGGPNRSPHALDHMPVGGESPADPGPEPVEDVHEPLPDDHDAAVNPEDVQGPTDHSTLDTVGPDSPPADPDAISSDDSVPTKVKGGCTAGESGTTFPTLLVMMLTVLALAGFRKYSSTSP
jgi:hypothetical protein